MAAGPTWEAAAAARDAAGRMLTTWREWRRRARDRADLARGVTTVGPHRDEVLLTVNDLPARGYASHGESWSLALALRLGRAPSLGTSLGSGAIVGFSLFPLMPPRLLNDTGTLIGFVLGVVFCANIERIRNVAHHVKREVDAGHEVAVVVSAMSGVTNQLVAWCRDAAQLHDAREYDAVVATGEQVTAGLLALALQRLCSRLRQSLLSGAAP